MVSTAIKSPHEYMHVLNNKEEWPVNTLTAIMNKCKVSAQHPSKLLSQSLQKLSLNIQSNETSNAAVV